MTLEVSARPLKQKKTLPQKPSFVVSFGGRCRFFHRTVDPPVDVGVPGCGGDRMTEVFCDYLICVRRTSCNCCVFESVGHCVLVSSEEGVRCEGRNDALGGEGDRE